MLQAITNNLAEILPRAAGGAAERIALTLGARHLTYAELEDASRRMAALLESMGVGPSDRVGIMLPNVPEFAIAYYGVLRRGGVVVPMNVALKEREIAFYLRDSGARALLAWHDFDAQARHGAADAGARCLVVEPAALGATLAAMPAMPAAPDVAACEATDTAVIVYTSGTTGRPKGAELTHANLLRNADVAVGLFSIGPSDVVFGGLPLFHSFGQTCGLNAAIASGARLSLMQHFDPAAALSQLECDDVTIFEGVPTMYAGLLGHHFHDRYDLGQLRLAVCGGAALPVEVLNGFEAAFGCVVLEGYGLAETSPIASFNRPGRKRKPGSVGTPVEGVEMKIVDERGGEIFPGEVGEITIRGHNVMKGYWGAPDATAEAIDADGWFKTGDLARVDDDGYFYIVDRKIPPASAIDARAKRGSPARPVGVHARLTRWTGVPPESIRPVIDDYERTQIPFLESRPGFLGALVIADHAGGLITGVTLWSSRATMQASEQAAVSVRSAAESGFGHWERPLVDRCEVVFAKLPERLRGAAA